MSISSEDNQLIHDEREVTFEDSRMISGNVGTQVTSADRQMISGNDETEAIVGEQVEDFPENLHQTQNFISSPSPIVLSQSTPVNQIPNGNTEVSEAQRAATKRKDRLLLFNQAILPFVNKQLDDDIDEEWSTFEDLVNTLTTDRSKGSHGDFS